MKAWKMALGVGLLCAFICGSVAMGKRSADKQEAPETEKETETETIPGEALMTGEGNSAEAAREVSVGKTYSEGLSFRSNGDGTCAVSGIGACTAVCVLIPPESPAGDRVTEILPYAFRDVILGAVEIPATVEKLNAASFSGCRRLAYVRVAAGNAYFREEDGVLYSADGSVLVFCPQERAAGTLTLGAEVKRIAAGAFEECSALGTVVFRGSSAAWHGVIVGDGNAPLFAAGMTFKE